MVSICINFENKYAEINNFYKKTVEYFGTYFLLVSISQSVYQYLLLRAKPHLTLNNL